MTPAEIELALEGEKGRQAEGFVPVHPHLMGEWAERRRRMTFAEQLKEARGE
jgi:hypothetical protein